MITEHSEDPRVEELELLAWVGEDEMGSGRIGIKQALVPAGMIPLAAIGDHLDRLTSDNLLQGLQLQATHFGKTIRLCRFRFVAEEITIRPKG